MVRQGLRAHVHDSISRVRFFGCTDGDRGYTARGLDKLGWFVRQSVVTRGTACNCPVIAVLHVQDVLQYLVQWQTPWRPLGCVAIKTAQAVLASRCRRATAT